MTSDVHSLFEEDVWLTQAQFNTAIEETQKNKTPALFLINLWQFLYFKVNVFSAFDDTQGDTQGIT